MPPGINLILILIGLLGLKKYQRGAVSLLIFSIISLILLSLPITSHSLLQWVEPTNHSTISDLKLSAAKQNNQPVIVVLSAGRDLHALEYGNINTVNAATLQRLNYASWLQKKLNLPVLLSGGSQSNQATSDAVLMNQTMIASYSVTPNWIEPESRNLAESALNVATILNQQNSSTIILITHAIHMQRASYIFEKQGFNVIAAPIAFSSLSSSETTIFHYIPNISALITSQQALIEAFTLLWYKIRY